MRHMPSAPYFGGTLVNMPDGYCFAYALLTVRRWKNTPEFRYMLAHVVALHVGDEIERKHVVDLCREYHVSFFDENTEPTGNGIKAFRINEDTFHVCAVLYDKK